MNKELITEINRIKEILGLKQLNEASTAVSPVYEAVEKFFEYFGVKNLEKTQIESIEAALAKEGPLFKQFDDLGTLLKNPATLKQGESLAQTLVRDLSTFKRVITVLEREMGPEFSTFVDKAFQEKLSGGIYDKLLKAYEIDGTNGVLNMYKAVTPTGNQSQRLEFMLGKWKPKKSSPSPAPGPATKPAPVPKPGPSGGLDFDANLDRYLGEGGQNMLLGDIDDFINQRILGGKLKLKGITKEQLAEEIKTAISGPYSLNRIAEDVDSYFNKLGPSQKIDLLNKAQKKLQELENQGIKINKGYWEKKWESYKAGGISSVIQLGKDFATIYATGVVASAIYYISTEGIGLNTFSDLKKSLNWVKTLIDSGSSEEPNEPNNSEEGTVI